MRESASFPGRASRHSGRFLVLATLLCVCTNSPRLQQWGHYDVLGERRRARLAYDVLQGRLVLAGGTAGRGTNYTPSLNDTWEWSNGAWTLGGAAAPTVLNGHGMFWDARHQIVRTVAFPSAVAPAIIWEWRRASWQPVNATFPPPFREHFATAYDESRQRLVMWGGTDSIGAQLDVWEFDGFSWSAVAAPSPAGRNEPELAYDGVRGKVVMFGGRDATSGQALADMWEWDGAVWTQLAPATLPTPRNGHSMTWDPTRRRVVLFGGSTATPGTTFNDTWEWDGTNWTQIVTPASPPARTEHAATYHSGRNRVIVACGETATGLLKDTWEYDGSTWVQVTPPTAPDGLADHASAFDSVRGDVILFGGRSDNQSPRGETWRWHLAGWSKANPTTSPAARFDHAMVFDRARGRIVLFGGFTSAAQNDTWLWDGSNWTQAAPVASPPARSQHAMAYDARRSRVVLFGGTSTGGVPLGDTWEWDGNNWTQTTPTTSPLARADHGMAYDMGRTQIVLFGGRSSATTYRQDTWVYDGTTWTNKGTVNVSARGSFGMDYDPLRKRVFMFGGKTNSSTYASPPAYTWNGTTWSILTILSLPQPSLRGAMSMSWDGAAERMLAFGGEVGSGTSMIRSPETWAITYHTRANSVATGLPSAPCLGPNPAVMQAYGVPYVGSTAFALDFVPGLALIAPSPVAFLLSHKQSNGAMFGPCPLIVDPASLYLVTTRMAVGTLSSQPMPIPLAFDLMGTTFVAQCAHFDPPTANNGLAFSAGLRVTIGDF